MTKVEKRRYQMSIAITFSFFLLLMLLLPLFSHWNQSKRHYGESHFFFLIQNETLSNEQPVKVGETNSVSPKELSSSVAEQKKRIEANQESPSFLTSSSSKTTSQEKPHEDEDILFEELLTGTKKSILQNKSSQTKETSVEYKERHLNSKKMDSSKKEGNQGELFSASSTATKGLLSDVQREQLAQGIASATKENPQQNGATSSPASLSENKESLPPTIGLEEYEQNRKKVAGTFPLLKGFDLAGRRVLEVEVQFYINPSGTIQRVEILKSSGSLEIDLELMKAFRFWKFEPISENRIDSPKLRLQWRAENEN